jgi:ParB family chromosome partitioning protein
MARKNLLTGLTERKAPSGEAEEGPILKPPSAAFSGRGAFGAVTRTIDDLAARADAARALEARITAGEMVVELDPALIDSSFIADRMETDDENYRALRDSIAAKGQDSPILVRPHPDAPGRYQVAFGHRRLRAAADLGRSVRCIVKPLSDRDLVIAQGQENSARADLSFIERGRFAQTLEWAGYDRQVIMQALTIDKTTLSRLIGVVNRLPTDIVEAIGPAHAAGRDRWVELATVYVQRAVERPVDPLLESAVFKEAPSDTRFEMLFEHLSRPEVTPPEPEPEAPPKPVRPPRVVRKPRDVMSKTGLNLGKVTVNENVFVLTIERAVAKDFGEFLLSRVGSLYEEYVAGPPKKVPFQHSIQR